MHLAQAKTRSPEGKRTHCRFGYFLFLTVGLYFPLSFLSFQTIIDPFLHIVHCFAMVILSYQNILILARFMLLLLIIWNIYF